MWDAKDPCDGEDEQARDGQRERLDALLLDGLNSGAATPLVKADWDRIRREGAKLIAKRKRSQR
jgi:antitoxin ParD1/3/4